MSAELETAAADSLSHLAAGRGHAPPPGGPCANCGAILQGHYCHVCGQSADTHQRSIRHLIWEAIEALFELDGRLWRTVPALFFRPGRLARDYREGRVARHVPPFRTFLVALLLFIFAAEHATHQLTLASAKTKAAEAAALATPQGRAAAVAKRRAEAVKDLNENLAAAAKERAEALKEPDEKPARAAEAYARSTARAQAHYARSLDRADRVAKGEAPDPDIDASVQVGGGPAKAPSAGWKAGVRKAVANPDYYWAVVFTWGHRMAILLLPIVGLSLALVYRNRKQIFLYDHLLVAMNLLSFSFLTNALGLVLPFTWMPWWFGLVALWTPVNLFQTLRGAYDSSLLGATLKTLVVWGISVFAFSVLMTGVLVLAVIQL